MGLRGEKGREDRVGIANLEHLKPGMRLRSDVADTSGRVLLRAGSVISEKHLKIFATWGVTEADVETGPEKIERESTSAPESESLKKAKAYVRSLFRHTDPRQPAIQELMRLCIMRKTQEKPEQKTNG